MKTDRRAPPPPEPQEVWLKVGQIAARLGVHPETARRYIDDGLLPSYVNEWTGHRRVRLSDLEAFIERSCQPRS